MIIITLKIKNVLSLGFVFFLFYIFFTNAKNIGSYLENSLKFCALSVIPSLFPYMCASSVITYTACLDGISKHIPKKLFSILGVCRKYFVQIICGCVCGFVTGAVCICDKYACSDDQRSFSDSIILCSNAGVGFTVGYVGVLLWGSLHFGILLYLTQIFVAFTINAIINCKATYEENRISQSKALPLLSSLSRSVSVSCMSIIKVCGFTVFFSLVTDTTSKTFGICESNDFYRIMCVAIEFCRGTTVSASAASPSFAAALTGFCIGFGGICVHSQIFSVCEGYPLNKSRFFIFKTVQGIFCAIFAYVYATIFDFSPSSYVPTFSCFYGTAFFAFCIITVFVIIIKIKNIFFRKSN